MGRSSNVRPCPRCPRGWPGPPLTAPLKILFYHSAQVPPFSFDYRSLFPSLGLGQRPVWNPQTDSVRLQPCPKPNFPPARLLVQAPGTFCKDFLSTFFKNRVANGAKNPSGGSSTWRSPHVPSFSTGIKEKSRRTRMPRDEVPPTRFGFTLPRHSPFRRPRRTIVKGDENFPAMGPHNTVLFLHTPFLGEAARNCSAPCRQPNPGL